MNIANNGRPNLIKMKDVLSIFLLNPKNFTLNYSNIVYIIISITR